MTSTGVSRAGQTEHEAIESERIRWGHTTRTRLAWLLDRVVYADLLLDPAQEDERRYRVVALLRWITEEMPGRWAVWSDGMDRARARESAEGFAALVQQPLRRVIDRLMALRDSTLRHEFTGTVRVSLAPVEGGWLFEQGVASSLTEIAIAALLAAIARTPPSLLRVCQWTGCGRVFLARKTQRTCPAHQVEARRGQYRAAQQRRRERLKAGTKVSAKRRRR